MDVVGRPALGTGVSGSPRAEKVDALQPVYPAEPVKGAVNVDCAAVTRRVLPNRREVITPVCSARATSLCALETGGFAHLAWWQGEDNHNIDAWESETAFGEFGESRLGPAMAAVGVAVQPEVTFYDAHEVYLPQARTITAG